MNKVKSAPFTKTPAPPVTPLISQAELALYRKLQPLAHEFARLDRAIKAAMREGAPVEPGLLALQVRERRQRRRLQRYLFRRLKLSPQLVEKLRAEAPLVAYRSLAVVPVAALAQP